LARGDRVAIEPAITCGRCDQCESGRENTCRNLRFLGCPGQAEGGLSQYLVMPQHNCFQVSDSLGLAEATISEPLAIGVYALQQAGLQPGARIGILGMGPIGRTILLPALAAGCSAAYCTDKIDDRCAAARKAGASWVGNPSCEDVVAAIREREPLGLDAAFECCGQQEAIDQAIEILEPGGKLVIIGSPRSERVSFNINKIRRKEIAIINIRRQNECVKPVIDLVTSGKINADFMITHHFPLEQTKKAFDLVTGYHDGVIKAMISI